jgi:hypothetical protein
MQKRPKGLAVQTSVDPRRVADGRLRINDTIMVECPA